MWTETTSRPHVDGGEPSRLPLSPFMNRPSVGLRWGARRVQSPPSRSFGWPFGFLEFWKQSGGARSSCSLIWGVTPLEVLKLLLGRPQA